MTNPLYSRLFDRHATNDAPFLHLRTNEVVSYRDFVALAARMANGLRALGLEPGDRVAVHVEKSPEALAIFAACAQTGTVFLPLNPAYTPAEVAYFVSDAGAGLLVCDPGKEAALAPIASQYGARCLTLGADGSGSFADLAQGQSNTAPLAERTEGDLAAILYTSGTTGRSKGAMLSQANLLSNAEVLTDAWAFTAEDVLLHALPIFHTHGLFVATNIIAMAGGSMIFLPKYDTADVLAALPKATTMMGVPTFYTRLLDSPAFTQNLARHMRLFISGSAPLLADTHEAFEARTGHRILERYGMTETGMNTSNPYDGVRRAGTVGPALPGVEVKVCDAETGAELPQGEIGILWVRGPNVFGGYWQMPEKTAEELRPDGFFITGDLARIDEDGYVQIVGRGKDLIISGGFNIYPKEVELLLDDQPGVLESAVVGAPHPDFGESVVAVLVPEAGATLDPGAIEVACRADLAGFKRPRHIAIVDALPRNTMGKVQKAQLRETYADVFQPLPE